MLLFILLYYQFDQPTQGQSRVIMIDSILH